MTLHSANDVAAWVLRAPYGNINETITTHATAALPAHLSAFVQALDGAGYIRAVWVRQKVGVAQVQYTWRLMRDKRNARQQDINKLLTLAAVEAKKRQQMENEDD